MNTSFLARVALVAALGACCACSVDETGSVDVAGICGSPDDASDCSMDETCENYLAARPYVYELVNGEANGLYLWMQFNNQLLDNSDDETGQTNSNTAYVDHYRLKFSTSAFEQRIPSVDEPALVPPVPAEGSSTAVATIIPPETLTFIASEMRKVSPPLSHAVVEVELRGIGSYGSGGSDRDFETGSFFVPVDVYEGEFPGYSCSGVDDVVTAVCPNAGQTSSWTCEAPAT